MHTAARKLHSQRGASILFALLVFMLCAFGGVAALVSAAANAGRYTRLERDQQQYLSAASAAGLLRDKLGGRQVTLKLTLRHTHTWWYITTPGTDPVSGEAIEVKTPYALDTYTFIDKEGLEQTKAADACYVLFPAVTGDAVMEALEEPLTQYLTDLFLQNDVPSYFYDRENTLSGGGTWSGTGTEAKPAAAAGSTCRLAIEGVNNTPDQTALHDRLGAVQAVMGGIGDYGLRAEVSQLPKGRDDTTTLYTAAFELPASVTRDIATKVTVDDNLTGPPDVPSGVDSAYYSTAANYGRRVTDNTLTVIIAWADDAPVVTRIY